MAACAEIEEELSAYLDGEVSADMRASIDEHLRTCTACQAIFAELKSIHSVLTDLPKLKAPATLAATIHNDIGAPSLKEEAPAVARPSAKIEKNINWGAAAQPKHSAWAPLAFGLAALVMLCLLAFVVVPAIMKNRPGGALSKAPGAHEGERKLAKIEAPKAAKFFEKEKDSVAVGKDAREAADANVALVEEHKNLKDGIAFKADKPAAPPAAQAPGAAAPALAGKSGGLAEKSYNNEGGAGAPDARIGAAAPAKAAPEPRREISEKAAATEQAKAGLNRLAQQQPEVLQKAPEKGAAFGQNAPTNANAAKKPADETLKLAQQEAQGGQSAEKSFKGADAAARKNAEALEAKEEFAAKQSAPKPQGAVAAAAPSQAPSTPAPVATAPASKPAPAPVAAPSAPPAPVAPVATAAPKERSFAADPGKPSADRQADKSVAMRKQDAAPAESKKFEPAKDALAAAEDAAGDGTTTRRRAGGARQLRADANKNGLDGATQTLVFRTSDPEALMQQIQALADAGGARIEIAAMNAGEDRKKDEKSTADQAAPAKKRQLEPQVREFSVLAATDKRESILNKLRELQAQADAAGLAGGLAAGGGAGRGAASEAKTKAAVPAEEPAPKTATVAPKIEAPAPFAAAPEERIVIRIEFVRNDAAPAAKAKATEK